MSKKKSKKKHKKERKRKRSSSSSDDEETCDKTENTRERKSSEAKQHHRARSRSEDKDNEKKRRRFSDPEPAKHVTHSSRSREKEYRKAVCKQGMAKAPDKKSSSLQGKQETVSKSCSDKLQTDTIVYKRPTNWKASLFEMRLLRLESEGRPVEKTFPREHQEEQGKLVRNSSKSSKEWVTHSRTEAKGLDTYHTLGRAVSSVGQSKDEPLVAFKKAVASNSPEHSLKEQYRRNERTKEHSIALREKPSSKPAMFGKTISFRIPKKSKPFENAVSDTKSKSCLSICDKKTSQRCQDQSGSDIKVSPLSPSRSSEKLKSSTVSKQLTAGDVQRTSSSTKATSQESDVDTPTESQLSRMTGDGTRKKRPLHVHKEKEKSLVAYNKKLILYEEDSEIPSMSSEMPDSHDTDQEMQLVVELHTARSEKLLEVNMVQSYGELTCMDIDLPEEKTNCAHIKGISHQDLLIVLDTNILLSHLEFVRTIKAHGLPGIGFPAIIIPWVVLQELDSLKNGKLSMHVVKKAIPAVNFIYTCLKNQDPQLWGQSMQQASQSLYGLSGENNDDRVLQCSLQYQSLYPNLTIILCTNDKNLCSKALLSGVKAVSKVDLVSELENLKSVADTHRHQALQVTWHPKSEESEHDRNDNEAERREAAASALGPKVASLVSILEECLGKVLSAVLEKEMKIAFDDLWMEIVYLKPPWTLPDLLQCFKKHWIAVFGQIVCRDLLSSIDVLYDNLYKGRTIDSTIIKLVLQEAYQFLQAFKSRSDYDGVLSQAFAVVSGLLQDGSQSDCQTQEQSPLDAGSGTALPRGRVSPLPSDDETLMSDEQNSLEPRPSHREVWAIFENIWSTVCQYSTAVFATFNYPYTPGALLPDGKLPPPEEAYACLQKLLAAVKELLACFQRVLAQNSCFKDVQNLSTFIASSEITTMGQRFTAQELYECLSQQEYREKLSMGWNQLAELNFNLEQCNTAVCMEARVRGWM